jgi:4-amino-4-deoxy-L-arabinose transferase-like glycosyltransferase
MSARQRAAVSRPPHFLAGPVDQLRLSWQAGLMTLVFGLSLLLVSLAGRGEWPARLGLLLSASATALPIALLAARWFGARIGMLAGMVQFTVCDLLQLSGLQVRDGHLMAAVTVAMCSFAAANGDSPRGRSEARWLRWAFGLSAGVALLLAGPLGPGVIFSTCALYLLINQDLRSMRFFVDPAGLAPIALCIVLYSQVALPSTILDVSLSRNQPIELLLQGLLAMLPWLPLLPLYLWRHRGQGVLVEPLWRLVACWLFLGLPLLWLPISPLRSVAPLLPGVCIFLAVALVDLLQSRQRGHRFFLAWLESRRLFRAQLAAVMAAGWLLLAAVAWFAAV